MPEIDEYTFGRVTIDGHEETHDVIVLPERVVRGWLRKEGHGLVLEDLDGVLDELPERLLVGTGAYRQLRPDPGTLETPPFPWARGRGARDRGGHPALRPARSAEDGGGATPDVLTVSRGRAPGAALAPGYSRAARRRRKWPCSAPEAPELLRARVDHARR
jgi:hypothetical protein